jgi:sulfatase maturation enzyme AslB (radical SAM superfamily)
MSNAISFRIPGNSNSLSFNPCCLYDNYLPFQPTYFEKDRTKFIEAKTFLPGCSICELKEKTHGKSYRTVFNDKIPDDIGDSVYRLEIVLDTTCNAACIQCTVKQSSLWRQQVALVKNEHIKPEQEIDSGIEQIKSVVDLNKVKMFNFWGGEPLLTETHLKFIKNIADPSLVSLTYSTNGSIFPNRELLDLWSKFKLVKLQISVDDVNDRFHYIRWPLQWDKVSTNIIRFKNEVSDNIEYSINCCVLPLNVLYLNELEEWLSQNFFVNNNGKEIGINFIRGEGKLDIANTPMRLREEVWKKFGMDHVISKILRELPVSNPTKMIEHITYWDKVRKLDVKETFPEIIKFFN